MSLFSSIQLARNTLRANEIAMQVVGQNLANASTPGYIREELELTPAPTQCVGGLMLGLGVQVTAVVQKLDKFLEERLRGSVSDQSSTQTTRDTYAQLEGLIGALNDTSLNSSMTKFFDSISEILNQPADQSVRNLAVLQGDSLTKDIQRMSSRAAALRDDMNTRIQNMGDDINRLVEQIRTLNIRIADTEGGSMSKSEAVGLRDQRLQALQDLSKLIEIRVVEQPSGGVVVYAGSDFLVYEGTARKVEVVCESEGGFTNVNIHLATTDAPLEAASGELRGLLDSRDEVLTGFISRLDSFARTLAFEFNKIYSSGQGLNGYSEMSSEFLVTDRSAALDDAGLVFSPVNGSFQVLVRNKKTGLTRTTDIRVDLTGLGHDTTLTSLAASLAGVGGLSVQTSISGGLSIAAQSPDDEFGFANDTSGALAALGLNTFFTGSSARDLGVNAAVRSDPAKFAASRGGLGADTDNAVALADFIDRPVASENGASVGVLYSRLVNETTQGSAVAKADADGANVFQATLQSQKLAISGVNIDEEAVKLIQYQRSYQASAKYIATLNDLFDVLVNL